MSLWAQSRLLRIGDDDFPLAAELWGRPDARAVACGVDGVAVTEAGGAPVLDWRPVAGDFDPARCWLLDADRAWFALNTGDGSWCSPSTQRTLSAQSGEGEHQEPSPLREVWPLLGDEEAAAAVAAVALVSWHESHGFCSACGCQTEVRPGGYVRDCPRCGAEHFPRIDPAIIVALVDNRDRLLLGGQSTWGKRRSVFAGFVMAGESLEQAVHREVGEEVGLAIDHVHYFGSQPWPFPRSLMVAFTAHVENPDALHVDGHEIVRADWFTRQQVLQAWGDGTIDPPPPMSIARRLINMWLDISHPETSPLQ